MPVPSRLVLPTLLWASTSSLAFSALDLDAEPATLLAGDLDAAFAAFRIAYGRRYSSDAEAATRKRYFEAFLHRAAQLSADNPLARHGVTIFADESPAERAARLPPISARRVPASPVEERDDAPLTKTKVDTHWNGTCVACRRFPQLAAAKLPTSWDWTAHGAVASVKSQGGCGGCYAFAAAAAIEGAWYLSGAPLASLSVEQIVACDRVRSDGGCGGSVTNLDTFQYVIRNGGLAAEEAYPFSNASLHDRPPKCDAAKASKTEWRISGHGHLNDTYPGLNETFPGGSPWHADGADVAVNESRVLEALVRVGPLSIAVNAGRMDSYKGGVDAPPAATQCPYFCCYPEGNSYSTLDHEVLLVGFGDEGGVPYWKIKNSWGPQWGEEGYFRVKRGMNSVGVACDVLAVAR